MCWLLLAAWPCSGKPQTAATGGVRGRPAVPGLRALVDLPWVAVPWGCAWAGGGTRFFARGSYFQGQYGVEVELVALLGVAKAHIEDLGPLNSLP